ncbi:MAG TPA: hypothetical protein VLB68_01805 [Pyrinomonadaceae bacterium]|nr:hypothetical protein [Pyrinomonadaceae bacterium]
MEVTDSTDEILIRYLFNEQSKEENEELEDEMVLDPELSDRAQVVEMKLIESYVLNQMKPAEKVRFEKGFLLFSENRNKVDDARAFHESLRRQRRVRLEVQPPVLTEASPGRFASLFRMPVPAMAVAVLILVTTIVVVFLLIPPGRPNANVSNNNASTNIKPEANSENTGDAPANSRANETPREEIAKLNSNTAGAVVISITETRGRVNAIGSRGPDSSSQVQKIKPHLIKIPVGSESFTLRVSLMSHEYYKEGVDCSVDISNAKFQRLFPKGEGNYLKVKAKSIKGKFPYQVSIKVPTAYLKEGSVYYFRIAETDSLTPFKVRFTN